MATVTFSDHAGREITAGGVNADEMAPAIRDFMAGADAELALWGSDGEARRFRLRDVARIVIQP